MLGINGSYELTHTHTHTQKTDYTVIVGLTVFVTHYSVVQLCTMAAINQTERKFNFELSSWSHVFSQQVLIPKQGQSLKNLTH